MKRGSASTSPMHFGLSLGLIQSRKLPTTATAISRPESSVNRTRSSHDHADATEVLHLCVRRASVALPVRRDAHRREVGTWFGERVLGRCSDTTLRLNFGNNRVFTC